MKKIQITAGDAVATAELNDSETSHAIWEALPIEAKAATWGDEIYCFIPVHHQPENPKEIVEAGDLAYWPPGDAFCIFFGLTPASRGDEIRPASAVNIIGRVNGDANVFRSVSEGAEIRLERMDE